MSQDKPGPSTNIIQPLRDLESNWSVDLAKTLDDYLLKICSGEITGSEDAGPLSVNFAEAALMVHGSAQVYSRKVEYLHSLVLNALEAISQKSESEQAENESAAQSEEGGEPAAPEDEVDFWNLDDIPVEENINLDSATAKYISLDHYKKPPADLVLLEGDCLDPVDGELDSYLLASKDLYKDFILLDSSDSLGVDDFLKEEDANRKGKNSISRGSSPPSIFHKSFIRESGGKNEKNEDLNHSPRVDLGFEDHDVDDKYQSPTRKIPNDFAIDDVYPESGHVGDSDDSDDDDPWKPLNPHEPGTLKVKPFKKVNASKREVINAIKRNPLTEDFPLAQLRGPISSELAQIWETKLQAKERQHQEPKSPPLYEKLRQSLVLGADANLETNFDSEENKGNDYDGGDAEFELHDFDFPESSYLNQNREDVDAHFPTGEDHGHENPSPEANLEELHRSHLDSLLANIAETEQQTELDARVAAWKQKIDDDLEEQNSRPQFDIHDYGKRVLDKLSVSADSEKRMTFTDVVRGQEKHDVARSFSALLELVNNGSVELQRDDNNGDDDESACYTGENPFHVKLLRNAKRREVVELQSEQKKAKPALKKGDGDKSGSTSSSMSRK